MPVPKISYSAAKDFETCGYRYLLGFTDVARPFQPSLALGNALHAVAANTLMQVFEEQALPDLDELLPQLAQRLRQTDPSMEEPSESALEEMLEAAEPKLQRLTDRILPKVGHYQPVAFEDWFEIIVDDGAGEVAVVGKMDWLFQDLSTGTYVVYDLKSGAYFSGGDANNPQLAAYIAAVKVKYGEKVGVRAFCAYLEGSLSFVEYDQNLLEEDLEYLVRMARRIHTEKDFGKNHEAHCVWCPYEKHCLAEDA